MAFNFAITTSKRKGQVCFCGDGKTVRKRKRHQRKRFDLFWELALQKPIFSFKQTLKILMAETQLNFSFIKCFIRKAASNRKPIRIQN